MVCHRWTLALILISVPILATVISAFRVRLPGASHEVRSERRHKCEDCGVSDLNLDPVVRSFKKESEKRSYDGIKKVLSEKRHVFEEKLTKKDDERDDSDDETGDEDDSDSVKTSFERLDKFELKSKLDSKTRNKKASLIIDFSDDDDDDDDSRVEDDDDYDLPISSDHKKPVVEDTKKKIDDKQKSTAFVKPLPKPVTLSKDKKDTSKKDEEKEGISGQIKPKLDLSTIKTTLKETLRSKEIEKTSKAPSKVEEISKKQKDSKEDKEADLPMIKVASKLKDTLMKDSIISEPKEKVIKTDAKEKEKSKQKIAEVSEPVKKNEEKVVVEDVSKRKTVSETKKSVETTSDEKVVRKRETTKSESKDSRIQHVSDALHRRNLLHSEFEDFYAFFPTFAPNFSRVHNPECRRHGQILLRQLRGTKLWALNMLDATAKIPSGLLQGNGIQLGDFDQCLGTRARVQLDTGSVVRLQGKYCLAMIDVKAEHPELETPVHLVQSRNLFKSRIDDPGHFVPRFSTLSWGVCVPSPCGAEDVEVILRDAVKHYQYKTGISIRVKVDDHDCYTRRAANWWKEWLDLPTILTLSLYTTVITLVVIATLQDFLATNNSEEEASDEGKSEEQENGEKKEKQRKNSGFLSSFSLYNTLGKLVAPATSDEIACIHGVRAIATVALLFAHKFLPVALTPYTNRVKIGEVLSSPLLSWCRAGWMFTDCFLLISGTLTSYRKSTSDTMASKLLSRYFRLTPALSAVVLFYAYVWDEVSSGPMWGSLVTRNAELCRQGWWWNLLYVQNYFGFEEMCAPHTHHMALDFQLTILGGILVWAIQSDVPFSGTVTQLLHLLSAYSRYSTYRDHRLTALAYQGVSVSQLYRTGRLSYTSILHRCSPYLIGLSLGLALRKTTAISKVLSFTGWFICASLWGLVLWAGADSGYFDYRYDVTFAAIYATLAPLATGLAFAWMIYAVHKNPSGILSGLLCSRPLLFISRISYALYLIQFIVYLTNTATIRSPKEFSVTTLIDLQEVSTILLSSILLTITLVIPLQSLPKISFDSKAENVEENNTDQEKETPEQNEIKKKDNDIKSEKEEIIREVPQRRSFMAHREVLEEIPEVDVEYENQRESNNSLEVLEEDDLEDLEDREEDDLEIIEEEQGEEEEESPEGNEYLSRSFSGDNEQDNIDEWEWTTENDRGGEHNRYNR